MRYQEGDRVIYVSAFNYVPVDLLVSPIFMTTWSSLWQDANVEFDVKLKDDPDLTHFCGKMFFIWENDHQLTTWWRHINNNHADENWHISVDYIVVDSRGCTRVFFNAINDINCLVLVPPFFSLDVPHF